MNPSAATTRCRVQDNKLTRNTAAINDAPNGEIPVRPKAPKESAGRHNAMLRYANGTRTNNATLNFLVEVECVIACRSGLTT